jgi:NhaA family Na+:H+ antiporter
MGSMAKRDTHNPSATMNLKPIISESEVLKRTRMRHRMHQVTENSVIAAGVMVLATLAAVLVANTPAADAVQTVMQWPVELRLGDLVGKLSFESCVNDFLMAIFFLEVGIELKYEMVVGHLRYPRQAMVPMLAAVGGVAVPAIIFTCPNWGGASHGWAVPIATDIAFALGVMSLAGERVVPATKVFFQTLAIADDILAIVVLALFYGQSPNIAWCAASGIVVVVLAWLNHAKVYSLKPYLIIGFALWVCMYNSGIHSTLAGVILALTLPVKSDVKLLSLSDWLKGQSRELDETYDEDYAVLGQREFTDSTYQIERILHRVTPPLQRAQRYFSTATNFVILPLFAFVNAQVRLVGVDMAAVVSSPITRGIYFGAVLGKPIGIIGVTLLLEKLGFARLPREMDTVQVVTMGLMGGVGFTMSILLSNLAFAEPEQVLAAKCAIMAASVTAAISGLAFLHIADAVRGSRRSRI